MAVDLYYSGTLEVDENDMTPASWTPRHHRLRPGSACPWRRERSESKGVITLYQPDPSCEVRKILRIFSPAIRTYPERTTNRVGHGIDRTDDAVAGASRGPPSKPLGNRSRTASATACSPAFFEQREPMVSGSWSRAPASVPSPRTESFSHQAIPPEAHNGHPVESEPCRDGLTSTDPSMTA